MFFLGWFRGHVGPVQWIFVLLGSSSQPSTKYYFPHRTLFHFISSHRPATWAGSRAGSPVSVSPVSTVSEHTVTHGLNFLE